MAQLPYMISASAARRILDKIMEAPTPSKFTQNYLSTTLGFDGPNDKAFVSFAKSMGFLDSGGVPTNLYKQFRNPDLSAGAVARGLIEAYRPLYNRNERFFDLSKPKLLELVCEETGLDHDNITAKRITNTLLEVKKLANFANVDESEAADPADEALFDEQEREDRPEQRRIANDSAKLTVAYNLNLILPNTDDPKVFNTIFRSLKDNLL